MKQLNWYQIFGNTHTIPEGSTVTPTDDVQILLHCANIWDKSYTTISQVIADDDTLFLTLIDNNAIDYLVRSTTFASSIVASESAMQYIGASDYASETLLSDSTWLTAIDGSAYKDYVANVKNPNMTSNTTPEGEVIYSYAHSEYRPYYAFDGNLSTPCAGPNNSPTLCYYGYKFTSARKILYCSYYPRYNHATKTRVQASVDNNTWVDMSEFQECPITDGQTKYIIPLNSLSEYQCYRCQGTVTDGNGYSMNYWEINFYGRENAGVQTWLKAGGITNKKYTTVSEVLSDLTTLATLMASTDAIDYLVTAKGWATEICSDSNAMADIGMNNYAANTLLADETWKTAIANSAYIESVMNVKAPIMTDDTHPYGTASATNILSSSYPAYYAFDENDSTYWLGNSFPQTVYYTFPSAVNIYMFKYKGYGASNTAKDIALVNGDSGDAVVESFTTLNDGNLQTFVLSNHVNLAKCGLKLVNGWSGTANAVARKVQFYGRKDI